MMPLFVGRYISNRVFSEEECRGVQRKCDALVQTVTIISKGMCLLHGKNKE